MRLLTLTNRFYLISILLFFIVSGFFLFFLIRYHLDEELNEQLNTEYIYLSGVMQKMDSLDPNAFLLNDNLIVRQVLTEDSQTPVLFDTLIYDKIEKEAIPCRALKFNARTKSACYILTLTRSVIESTDLLYSIFVSLIIVSGLFSILLFLANYYFSKKLWAPFLHTISVIKEVQVGHKGSEMNLEPSQIVEFNDLNLALKKMFDKITSDFHRMKSFSENASHELQTPLAVIRSKLETLLQAKDLNQSNALLINQALEGTIRMAKINQTLLLLTKIENGQFAEKQKIFFSGVFDKCLEIFKDIAEDKGIHIHIAQEDDYVCEMNPILADIMVSNLLSNSIHHNVLGGFVNIQLRKNSFSIENGGAAPACETALLFERFKKGGLSQEHIGLGLALVKEIVGSTGMQITYTYHGGIHKLEVTQKAQ